MHATWVSFYKQELSIIALASKFSDYAPDWQGCTCKRQVEYFDLQPTLNISKFTCISSACLPAVRPGCARCRAPELSHNKGNGGGFTKMLFRRRFTHCAMAIPFILHSLPCSSIFLARCESRLRR